MRAWPFATLALLVLACSGAPEPPSTLAAPTVDVALPLRGVADPAADPGVVLLTVDGQPWCSGTLLESDVVLTARRCVSIFRGDASCPVADGGLRDLDTLHVLVGNDVASAVPRAHGRDVRLPPGDDVCGSDVALLFLDAPIDDVDPVVLHRTGAASGDHVRTVAFGAAAKVVRDHVAVPETSSRELLVQQAPCVGLPGGAVVDPASGELLGVLSRGGPRCAAPDGWEVATRADAFAALIDAALAAGHASHAAHRAKEKKGAIDQGARCDEGRQCAAGVCVTYAGAQYCTRSCSSTDRCPSLTRCMTSQQSTTVCVAE